MRLVEACMAVTLGFLLVGVAAAILT